MDFVLEVLRGFFQKPETTQLKTSTYFERTSEGRLIIHRNYAPNTQYLWVDVTRRFLRNGEECELRNYCYRW